MKTHSLPEYFLMLWLSMSIAYAQTCSPPLVDYGTSRPTSITIKWNAYASGTTFEVGYRPQNTISWTTQTGLTLNAFSATGLTNNQVYEFRVRATCPGGGISTYKQVSYATGCYGPSRSLFTQKTFSDGVAFSWPGASSGDGIVYQFQWKPSSSSTWDTPAVTTTTLPYTISGLAANTFYDFRIKVLCEEGVVSNEYTGLFETECQTSLYYQYPTASTIPVSWELRETGQTFEVGWQPQSNAATWNTVTGNPNADYAITGLSPSTAYNYRVKATCANGSESAYQTGSAMTAACQPPYNFSLNTLTSNSVRLSWQMREANWNAPVELSYRTVGAADWTTVTPTAPPYALTGLADNTTYEWRLASICAPGASSTFASGANFTTLAAPTCPATTPNIPGSGNDRYWSISWSSEGDVRYNLRWRAVGTTAWSSVANQTSISYLIQGLSAATPYEWQVQTSCYTTGGLSAWSASGNFTTATQQPCLTPTNAKADLIADHRATLYWTSAQYLNAKNYEIQWRAVGAGSWNTFTVESDQSTSIYQLTNLAASTLYEFQVRAVCSPGYFSDFTASAQFTTQAPIVCNELTPSGLGNTEITSTAARFNWADMLPGDLEKYNLRYRPVGTTPWTNVTNYPVNTYPSFLSNLQRATPYEWQVQTVCPEGDLSPWSALAQFTTPLCESPIELNPLVYLNNKVRLGWSLVPGSYNSPFTVRYRTQNPVGTWTTVPNLSNGSFIEGLTGGVVYEWQLQKNCTSSAASDWVTGPAFTAIDCAYPPHGGVYFAVVDGGSAQVNLKWSRAFYYDKSGPNAVTFNLRYRVEGTPNWTILNGITDTEFNYDLYDLASNTTYEFQLQSNCRAGVQSAFSPSFRYRTVGDGSYYTVKDGDWNDYTVWSNARVPEPDPIFGNYRPAEIRHAITVPAVPEARVSRILYNGGTLILGPNARIGLLDKVPL